MVNELLGAGGGCESSQFGGFFVGVGDDLEEIVEGLEVSSLDGGGDDGFDQVVPWDEGGVGEAHDCGAFLRG